MAEGEDDEMMRTHGAGELRASHAGQNVTLAGWVHHRRDHGKVIFLDLRDASGTVQIVVHPDDAPDAYEAADALQREWCVLIDGAVAPRKPGTENPKLATGEIELKAKKVTVLSPAATPPFVIEDGVDVSEETRLKYRYLDLRRPEMQHAMRTRHAMIRGIREFLDERDFVHIDTPNLTRSTPEGARDFLVPSRLHPGSFFALPQSPQLFKQLMMVAGLERYYQIARCFRDEDLRADRQLEFMQLDLEMSFCEEQDVQTLMEELMVRLWRDLLGVELTVPFPRMSYEEMMSRYGTDKADLRYGVELVDVGSVFASTQLGIFKRVLESGGIIKAIGVPGGGEMSNADLRRLEQLAKERGAGGLAWVVYKDGGEIDSPLAKFLSEDEKTGLANALGIGAGDLALLAADKPSVVHTVLGAMRIHVAEMRNLVPDGQWAFCWMTDPPLFEWDEDEKRYVSVHHPFTSPQGDDPIAAFADDPGTAKARAYDLVLNGVELGGGSIRIHRRDVQERVLEALKRDPSEFDFLLEAFGYGAPPHGGIALGLDRMAMLIAGASSLRDVIAFPVTGDGADPLTGAPTPVATKQLDDLGLKIKPV
ncbi:MAG TPA: aspartate--tRNA ligase [Actinomycetota bacterium]|nr:aspartate--tRNA ligase [Actinomycetota bacterium]